MNQMLRPGTMVSIESSSIMCEVQDIIGSGGQGEVYKIKLDGRMMALKWYFPIYIKQDPFLKKRLKQAIDKGAPDNRFLWPLDLASLQGTPTFGYIMPLRDQRYHSIIDLMRRRVTPSFRALATAGYQLSDSFFQLHAKGLCYRDISFGNVFFDPENGHVQICDNDNVDINNSKDEGGILGTPRFMAPEVVRDEAAPSRDTDLFSLSVLLFYMLMIHHPLEGAQESAIHAFDPPAMRKLYGTNPIFIYDPHNESNRPVPGEHDNAIAFWKVYPSFLRNRFTSAFTNGIRDPANGRVLETFWRQDMVKLRDSIIYCGSCTRQNFYDDHALRQHGNQPCNCWRCGAQLQMPPRIRISRPGNVEPLTVMLNHDSVLYPHHVDSTQTWNFSQPIAKMSQHPTNPGLWGLTNQSGQSWTLTTADGKTQAVLPGKSAQLAQNIRINFGTLEGQVRM
ncbi:protein kinase domain-containing protein [Herpetosiphon giganteus]|uniref:protein kinase domain-containing protein n=1 Tax=Herpetosiphon giganteus TaxID=2029754 RepID=UPI00195ADAC9|nr:hypothetical protein [Herpetosiphon giganteus]MBM7846530.1 serine/threonine protein kinase [Herpetosiphon giganteus]